MLKKIHPRYKLVVLEDGNIVGVKGGILKPRMDKYGYMNVSIYFEGKRYTKTVHRIVAESFLENPNSYPQINHKDGDKTNNRVANLEWCNHSQNVVHSYDNQLHKTKVSPNDVAYIYTNPENLTARELSIKFNIKLNTIYGLIYGNKWKYITKDLTPNVIKVCEQNHKEECEAISPSGEVFIFNNKSKFSRENKLTIDLVIDCLKGRKESHKGWKFRILDKCETTI